MFFLNKKESINKKCYNNIFKTLSFIYNFNSSIDNINEKIMKIFEGVNNNLKALLKMFIIMLRVRLKKVEN